MNTRLPPRLRQAGLSLVEMMVALALGLTVMSGVTSVLLVSKSNFVSARELATLQENARFAVRFLSDALMMAGFNGCSRAPALVANSVQGSDGNPFLAGTGLRGYDDAQGVASFPVQFRADVAPGTDAVLIQRAETAELVVTSHNPESARIEVDRAHDNEPGQVMVVAAPDCRQVGIFVMAGPNNNGGNADTIIHNTGNIPGVSVRNCKKELGANFDCRNPGASVTFPYPAGSSVMRLRSEAFYVGVSAAGNRVPALFREYLTDSGTTAEELVQGVENLQLLYGLDSAPGDGYADIYLDAGDPDMDWSRVVSVRLFLRLRSIHPVYNQDVDHPVFRGIATTAVRDRYMRQVVSTTVRLRNQGGR